MSDPVHAAAPLILTLADCSPDLLPLVGGKAAQLGSLIRAQLPVPSGFCLTTAAYRLGIEDAVRSEIVNGYRQLCKTELKAVAVRSSATAEDMPEASFAGQQDSFLNVEGEAALLSAVEACWQSLKSERAIAYRRERNIADADVAMAVVVQRMVPAVAAGVLFTIHPVTGAADEMVIEAARGLGDQVVSARVTPTRYRVRRRAPHDVISMEGEDTAVLSPAQIAELAGLGLRAERLLGRAADIEWAADAERIWLLQSRAVTAAGGALPHIEYASDWNATACKDRLIFLSQHNLRETMPYPHAPLSWAIWKRYLFPTMLRTMGVYGQRDVLDLEQTPAGIDQVEGRAYWNLNVCAGLFSPSLLVGMTRYIDVEVTGAMESALQSGELQPVWPPRGMRVRALLRLPALLLRVLWRSRPKRIWNMLEGCRREADKFRELDIERLDYETLFSMATYFANESMPRTIDALFASLMGAPAMEYLKASLPRWGFPEAFPRTLAGAGNPTLDTALALWDLAESAGLEVRHVFAESANQDIIVALGSSDSGRAFLDRLQQFMDRHGHRAVREFDLMCPRWRDDPTFVFDTLRNYFQHPADHPSPRVFYQRQLDERNQMMREVAASLGWHVWRRARFRWAMRSMDRRTPLREASKYYGTMGLAVLRDIYVEVGKRFAEQGRLPEENDIFFLTLEEIEQIVAGDLPASVARQKIPVRKQRLARQARANPALIVRSDGKPVVSATVANTNILRGTPVSWGAVRGPVRVLLDPSDGAQLRKGEILVAPFTDPGWTPLFLTAGALVMEVGGMISHGAVVAREYGIPAVVGLKDATRLLHDGEVVEVNGATGEVRRLT